MIGKISKGYSFRSLADYLLLDDQMRPRGRIIGGPMAGRTPRELAREFGKLRTLNPRLNRAVAHFVLSPSPDDAPLSDDTFRALTESFMQEMGFGEAPWCAVAHNDSAHPHLHVMASRIDIHAKTVSDAGDYRRSEKAIRRLERLYGLTVIDSPPTNENAPKPKTIKSGAPRRTARHLETETTTTTQENTLMDTPNDNAKHPFPADSPHAETWPEPFEPGRDAAELAMIDHFAVEVLAASCGDELMDRKRREIRRTPHEDIYEQTVRRLFPDDPPAIFNYPRGVILYFHQPQPKPGRVIDRGDKLIARGGMSEELAAKRIVALAVSPDRGWKSICFDGTRRFVELGMREAMAHGLTIHAKGQEQAEILARLMAEKRGGMGSNTGPVHRPPIADYPELDDPYLQDPILAHLSELDKLLEETKPPQEKPSQTAPRPASKPELVITSPAPSPVTGVSPPLLNIRERIQERRNRQQSKGPSQGDGSPPRSPVPPGPPRP